MTKLIVVLSVGVVCTVVATETVVGLGFARLVEVWGFEALVDCDMIVVYKVSSVSGLRAHNLLLM